MKNNKGFSLVELIIVIAIMAVLIGVLAPQFIKYVERSRESTDLQNIEEVKTAIESYVADNGESIGSGTTYTVTADKDAKTVKATTSGGDDLAKGLAEYGITGSETLKSGQWSKNIVWTYSTSDYTWKLDDAAPSATNKGANGAKGGFYANGDKYDGPTTP